ncbi:hypothetical protein K435DRAFT_780328 [Dendrothele bispora CBS 962.96]|uniref:Uncharacterized protein n=1 Tax=Dendrothele bispora (strain CBS 962.96) TaxID=1314807 RepID=A0A4S8LN51_DENBC|nr:hypothetical protein K435DRAFT_781089 [Dendrothele bispora CBS 962.96]THU92148.1 hypothetical protein K435DRAFT_780328 [Dendrothele bispora CBS 962.96]
MSSESSNLSSLTRSKLHHSVGSKDKCSLHRWVLLKNSFVRALPLTTNNTSPSNEAMDANYSESPRGAEETASDDADSFMFPDVSNMAESSGVDGGASEAQWLDSLLETLGDDDDDDFSVDNVSVLQPDDDDDHMLSPIVSPMSSSDDLSSVDFSSQADFSSPIAVSYPYPVPYPPFHPPLISYHQLDSSFDPLDITGDPLPYYDLEDVEDLPVPDAIEDTSDDESDTLLTPSVGHSSSSLLSLDSSPAPLSADRSRSHHSSPHVYIDSDDSSFYPYETDPDPLPFSDHLRSPYNFYQEC